MYDTPAPEFAVSELRIDGEHLGHEIDAPSRHDGPQILLCTEGSTVVYAKGGNVTLKRGSAAWVAADDGPIRLDRRRSDEALQGDGRDLGPCQPPVPLRINHDQHVLGQAVLHRIDPERMRPPGGLARGPGVHPALPRSHRPQLRRAESRTVATSADSRSAINSHVSAQTPLSLPPGGNQ